MLVDGRQDGGRVNNTHHRSFSFLMEKKERNIVTSSERSAKLRALQRRAGGPRQRPPEYGSNGNLVLFHQTAPISAPK